MPVRMTKKDQQMRLRLAQEAARILLESGSRDFAMAKRKAAIHLGARDTRKLPSNLEIEEALTEYQRLFRSNTQPQHLKHLREVASQAMHFFADFEPRLVGPVLSGTADINTTINLHVFTDTPEEIGLLLLQHNIPFQTRDKKMRISLESYEMYPAFAFIADQQEVEVIVFPVSKRQPIPLSTVNGKPMSRATLSDLQDLLINQHSLTGE